VSLQPVEYYNKLPSEPNVEQVIVLEPLIATGGTAVAATSILKDWGIKSKIKFITVCASRQDFIKEYMFKNYILIDYSIVLLEFVGDAGDRLYDTPHV
ncbi:17937_t:CDS:2, partial [Racocetra fulgida]